MSCRPAGFEKAARGGLVLRFMRNAPDKGGLILHFMPSRALSEMSHSPFLAHKAPVLQAIFTPLMLLVKSLKVIFVNGGMGDTWPGHTAYVCQ